jgi:SAM-dependent methyltransferase
MTVGMRETGRDVSELLNRPMLDEDLALVASHPWTRALRRLVAEYREQGLAVVNGGLAYSNLLEGPAQMLTGHPYRLWEYTSLFGVVGDSFDGRRFLDIGGAASPLPCLLAEHGGRVLAIEREPLLVSLSDHISRVRSLDLRAEVADAGTFSGGTGAFDVVTCVSVIEHVPRGACPRLFRNIARMLVPGGLCYLTFDYGTHDGRADQSIPEIAPLGRALEEAGLRFVGNDPRELPDEVLALRSAPRHAAVAQRMRLNRRPFDADTPWPEVGRYLVRRLLGLGRHPPTRYARHNFFRLFLARESGSVTARGGGRS